MKRPFLVGMVIILLGAGATNGNSFEFAERTFGPLRVYSGPHCSGKDIQLYGDLVFEVINAPDQTCSIMYQTERKIIHLEGGRGKLTGTSVKVSYEKYNDPGLLKKSLIHPGLPKARQDAKEGMTVLRASGGDIVDWISGKYKIRIMKTGESIPEADNIVNFYLEKYPPTYSITASDLDPMKINEYELERHLEIIKNGEKYRQDLRSKQDKFAGTMSQCQEETAIRSAAGLCEDALIEPGKAPPEGQRYEIGCPIAMNFDSSERTKLWQELEDRARKSDRLDFNRDTWTCSYVGPHWYHREVLVKLGFTKPELLLMYKLGVPKQFLPEDTELLFIIGPQPEP